MPLWKPDPRVKWRPATDIGGDEEVVWLRWLVRLRWVAIVAQVATLAFAYPVLESPYLAMPLVAVIGFLVGGNLRAIRWLSQGTAIGQKQLLTQLAFDVLSLTTFFLLGGGPDNPFTILYVIHVAMASIMLHAKRAALLTIGVVGCYASLFIFHVPLALDHHAFSEDTLIAAGRVVSFVIASGSVAFFVVGLASTLRERSRQLLEARDRTARTDRLRSVGTLAAGAAHELNTPLGTMGLRIRRISRRHNDPDTERDVDVVQQQLDRCKAVVEQLLFGAGDPSASGLERRRLDAMVAEVVGLWEKGASIGIEYTARHPEMEVELPRVAFSQALINLLENAREAQAEVGCTEPIRVCVAREGLQAVVRVTDRGCGLPEAIERVGDPFFTTKSSGTGLGVFVARTVAEGAGGGIDYAPVDGSGTEVRWWFPDATHKTTKAESGPISPEPTRPQHGTP
jgi:two-component system sensor histidine kinase RegB